MKNIHESRRKLLGSWKRVSAVRYEGSDGARNYLVERVNGEAARPWRVLVDGVELATESHRVPRRFIGCENACWAAEEYAERVGLAEARLERAGAPRQSAFSWAARAERREKAAK